MAAVELAAIVKSFAGTPVLRGVSLNIVDGEFLTLVGPSGCGKSTLLRIIAGLEAQDGGEIRIGGRLVDGVPPKRRDVAMVFQSYALYPYMTVRQNLALPLEMRRLRAIERLPLLGRLLPGARRTRRQIDEEVRAVGAALSIAHLFERRPAQLSGGQRQRTALGRAMVRQPQVFLMDEPLSNLDANLRVETRTEIAELHRRLKTTFIYVTHDQAEAMTLSDRIVVMHQGRIVQIGTASEIYRQPASTFVADFIGKTNFLSAHVMGSSPEGCLDLEVLGRVLRLPLPPTPPRPGERLTLLARPEAIRVARCGDGYAGHVRRTAYLGPVVEYDIDVAGVVLVATQYDPREVYPVGTEVRVQLVTEALYLLPKES
jgi:multiple sugar transport system ATP-binding protein